MTVSVIGEVAGQQTLTDLAAMAAAILVVCAAAAAAVRLPPVRWLGRTLVSQPVTAWLNRELTEAIEPIITQLHPNGGGSARDAIDRVEARLDDLADDVGPMLRDWRQSHPEMRRSHDQEDPHESA